MANFPYFSSLLKIDEGKSAKVPSEEITCWIDKELPVGHKNIGPDCPSFKSFEGVRSYKIV